MNHLQNLLFAIIAIILILPGLHSTVHAQDYQQNQMDHRDDYQMDSISGGDFRDYISTHITEDDVWAGSMRTFGSFHNHMQEMIRKWRFMVLRSAAMEICAYSGPRGPKN